jgi:catechol 2,3-dioxygenase-like lactoylglutathione lyase family enzyme
MYDMIISMKHETNVAKTHLSLNVADVERSAAWYEVFFGVPVHKRRPGYANFDLESPALKLALQEKAPSSGGPLNHLGILVSSTAEVLAAKERLEKSGLITFSEENVTCCYALQDKIWVRDPDGNAWEVYALLDDMEEDDDHDHEHEAEAVAACCTPEAMPMDIPCCIPSDSTCCK